MVLLAGYLVLMVLDDVVELLIGYLVLMILYDVVCSGPEVEEAALDDGYRNRKNYFFVANGGN